MEQFIQLLHQLNYWHWFGFAAVLLVVELLTGGGYLFWTGLSAVFVGLLVWIFPAAINWSIQLIIFAFGAIILAILWWWYLRNHPLQSELPQLNRRSEQYIGRVFTLNSPIENGLGMIRVDDSQWRVRADQDLPVGTKVKVIGADGVVLVVERI